MRCTALKHGFLSKQVVISSKHIHESTADFHALVAECWDYFQPLGRPEELRSVPGAARSGALCRAPLRLTVRDRPGIVASAASAIVREGINIDSVAQEPNMKKDRLSFVITVEPVAEPHVRRAVEDIGAMDFMLEPVLVLRIA